MTSRRWSLPKLFSARIDDNPDRLVVRLTKPLWTTEQEGQRLKVALDHLIAEQFPHCIAFELGHFAWISDEVVELLLYYHARVDAVELVDPRDVLVEKLDTMNLRRFFNIVKTPNTP